MCVRGSLVKGVDSVAVGCAEEGVGSNGSIVNGVVSVVERI